MIELSIDDDNILIVKVKGKIEEGDIEENVEREADYVIAEYGKVRGILIDATGTKGWSEFPVMAEERGFLKKHKEDVYRIALVGDQTWQKIIPAIVDLLVDPLIKHFNPGQEDEALEWLKESAFK